MRNPESRYPGCAPASAAPGHARGVLDQCRETGQGQVFKVDSSEQGQMSQRKGRTILLPSDP
jgi:hypothetical protein